MGGGGRRTDEEAEDERPGGHLRVVHLYRDNAEHEHRDCPRTKKGVESARRKQEEEEKEDAPKMTAYHHSGTCGYRDIRRAWISGCSCIARRLCIHICFRKNSKVCVTVDVMLAKLSP